jgi:mono/diheme cytochrome c family protein
MIENQGLRTLARMIRVPLMAMMLMTLSTFAAAEGSVSFSIRGKAVVQLSLAEMRKKASATEITVHDPHEDKDVTYEGFAIAGLFAAVYGEQWQKIDEALFTCVDGYQPVMPVDRFTKHAGYLVFRRLDQKAFTVHNRFQDQSDVPLAPFYLVWDNRGSEVLRAEGANNWPYQVVGVDLVDFADRFPKMSPPKTASDEVKRGFMTFRENCMACHTINGEGGNKAPELNYPVNVTEYFSDEWIRKWIMDPRSVRYTSTMPEFSSASEPDRLIADVLAYLKAMKEHKRKPQ